jgi:hypothetical protein
MRSRGSCCRCAALVILGALSIATAAAADDRPAKSGFWRIEHYGHLYHDGDHDHAWLLRGRTLYLLDRFGGEAAMASLKEIDFFLPIDGTLSGWAVTNEDIPTERNHHRKVQYLNDSGAVVFSVDAPWCDTNKEATDSYLWMSCSNSAIRIARHDKPSIWSSQAIGGTSTPYIQTFDGGRGAWLVALENVLRAQPEAADPRRQQRKFPFFPGLWMSPIGGSSDGRFLWVSPNDTSGQRFFVVDADSNDARWKQPAVASPYSGGLHVSPDGMYAYGHQQRVMADRRRIPFPDDVSMFRPSRHSDRAWYLSQQRRQFELVKFTPDGTWSHTSIPDARYLEPAEPPGNVEDSTQLGLWARCGEHLCLVDADGKITMYRAPEALQQSNDSEPRFKLLHIEAAPDHRHAFVRGTQDEKAVPDHLWRLGGGAPLDFGNVPLYGDGTELVITKDATHFWLGPGSGGLVGSESLLSSRVCLYGTADDIAVQVSMNKQVIDPSEIHTVRTSPREVRPELAATLGGRPLPDKFTVKVVLVNHRRIVATASPVDKQFGALQWSDGAAGDGPFVVEVHVRDEFGDEMTIRAGEMRFEAPILDLPWVRSLLVYAALLVLAGALLVAFRPSAPRVSRALPSLVAALGTGGAAIGPRLSHALDFHLDATVLLGLLGGTLGVCLIAGVVSAGAFRLIVETEPFHAMAPLLLAVPRVRRRLYLDHLRKRVEEPLRHARRAANDEHYSVVPARVLARTEADGAPAGVLGDPAAQICALVAARDPDARWDVLIESPGGRGKSALVREVVQRAAGAFRRDRGAPLPLLIEAGDGKPSLDALVIAAVKDCLVAATTVTARLRAGDFFVVVDGLSESSLAPDAVREFVRRDDLAVRALFATRPNERHRAALEAAARFAVVEPLELDETTLPRFVDTYRGDGPGLSDRLRTICRGRDGKYLPILVRLALLVGGDGADSIAAVYQQAFLQLLGRREAIDENAARRALDEAARLCLDTFWPDGHRGIAYADAAAERVELLDRLVVAGVLVPAGPVPRAGRPRELRFFHDSMQSYLTARALFARDDWKALARAAGSPEFQGGSDAAGRQSSEVLQMCLEVFAPDERLAAALRGDLEAWARDHGGDLARNAVLAAISEGMRGDVEAALDPALGGGAVLHEAVRRSDAGSAAERVHRLGALYGAVAPLVWPLRGPTIAPAAAPVEPQTTAA